MKRQLSYMQVAYEKDRQWCASYASDSLEKTSTFHMRRMADVIMKESRVELS